jgi:hypothetical protein
MTIYTVLAPPMRAGAARPDPDGFVFVKEGFCWPALFVPILWLVWHRLWLVLVGYLAVAFALVSVADALPQPVAALMLILFGFWVGLEANNLRRWTLERRGHHFLGVADGELLSDAEYRFFAGWEENQPSNAAYGSADTLDSAASKPVRPTPAAGQEIVGLFPATEVRT